VRRAASTALVLAGALLLPARARAVDVLNDQGDPPTRSYKSPQNFAVELKFGPYRPDVDSEFTDVTPYASYFGPSRHLLTQLELDWQIFRRFGSIGLGLGVGYFSVSGVSPSTTGVPTGDRSNLKVVPFSLSGVYRFDYFLNTRNFPLVPYGKLGLDYAYWRITDANDELAHDVQGNSGQGGTMGWHATAGVALMLDVFDPEAARDFDTELGVNHTAITFEYTHADISGLGQPNKMHLGDTTWALGLLFEF
jgi:hypothetical protein